MACGGGSRATTVSSHGIQRNVAVFGWGASDGAHGSGLISFPAAACLRDRRVTHYARRANLSASRRESPLDLDDFAVAEAVPAAHLPGHRWSRSTRSTR